MRSRVKRMVWIAPLAILGLGLFVLIGGTLVKYLWNWLLPPLFGWPTVTFWQALALLALCRTLFGGWSSHSSRRSRWRHRMDERCEQMTPEERERFRQRVRERWGYEPAPGAAKEE